MTDSTLPEGHTLEIIDADREMVRKADAAWWDDHATQATPEEYLAAFSRVNKGPAADAMAEALEKIASGNIYAGGGIIEPRYMTYERIARQALAAYRESAS